ncbi:MAG: prepilin-type N-terminal cleavage/methylation domain-containing protein [Verrucomicrobiota bacterium]
MHTVLTYCPRRTRGFTLTELMISMAIMMIVIAGTLTAHIMGLKMYGLTRAKLGANTQARDAINSLMQEVRAAKLVRLGNGSLTDFVEAQPGQIQAGNAIQLYTNALVTNFYSRYYLDTNNTRFVRSDQTGAVRDIVAEFITNKVVFTAEDFQGNILTNNQNNRVIGLTIQFYQIQYPITSVGTPGAYFDFYQIRTKITRRMLQ